jgi:phenylalanyl-tRNA synthetase beta chain
MKFTYNWLKKYVDFDWSPQELADKLTFAGIEVESVETIGGQIPEQVVVAQILASDKHPNADRLSVCRVNDGSGERQIVCGAKNYKVGDKVPLALPGASMAGGFVIKISKLRGVESQGMMCSAEELGLPKGEDGLLILPADAPLGKKFADYMGGGDTVYDIEVTPNRPDWLSVMGIAREIAALTGNPLQVPAVSVTESSQAVTGMAQVEVTASDLCPRYTARVIRGVKIGPSPDWLRGILEKVGMRSINNVVDITNYVLLESGHPLHAFDYNLVGGHKIVVRRAANGEMFEAIDDSKHELSDEMLVIADANRAVALAGVMGGKNSEIHDGTTDVLLESAWFLPTNVRKTSKRLGLSSESSYRFERGADIDGVIWASNRATALIQELAGGTVAQGIIDVSAAPMTRRRLTCRYAQVNRVLGVAVPRESVKKIFGGLSLAVVADEADACTVEVPTFRVDLEREADLIEEVCRIHGIEKVPAAMQPAVPAVSAFDQQWDARRRVRGILTGLGFHEALNQTMVDGGDLKLQNPLNAEMSGLRASLLPGLLTNLRTNVARHQYDVRLFEIGRVFAGDGTESLRLALALTGRREPESWDPVTRDATVDFTDLKGAVEELAAQLDLALEVSPGPVGAEIRLGGDVIGRMEMMTRARARKLDLRDDVMTCELDLERLLAGVKGGRQFRELPRFPAVVRDVALVVEERVRHADVMAAIGRHPNKNLERVILFDIFRGGSIPSGRKSMAYSLTFRSETGNLTDAEVNKSHDELKRQLQQELQCEIRES